jgi:hypothetical protein
MLSDNYSLFQKCREFFGVAVAAEPADAAVLRSTTPSDVLCTTTNSILNLGTGE